MSALPLLGPSYNPTTRDVSTQRLINFYLEEQTNANEQQWVALPTPGLIPYYSFGASIVRGMIEHKGVLYVVAGDTFYSVVESAAGVVTATSQGVINSTELPRISMCAIDDYIVFTDSLELWSYRISTDTFAAVTDGDLPAIPATIASINGYVVYPQPTNGTFYVSDLNAPTSVTSTFYATAEIEPDPLKAVVTNNTRVWLLGSYSTEIWYNSGVTTGAPFDRYVAGAMAIGTLAPYTTVSSNNQVIFLGWSKQGFVGVVQADESGYKAISSRALNEQILRYDTITDAVGFSFNIHSHRFYVLTFPSASSSRGVTWLYDFSTGVWSEWESTDDEAVTSPLYTRHKMNCFATLGQKQLCGNWQNGQIYQIDTSTYTDGGDTIRRQIVTPHISMSKGRITISEFELDVEGGIIEESSDSSLTEPQVMLEVSKDYGRTWSNILYRGVGTFGEYKKRVRWNRLGMGRAMTFRLTMSDPVPWQLLGVWAKIRVSPDAQVRTKKDEE